MQRETQNPDVNSIPDENYGAHEGVERDGRDDANDVEGGQRDEDIIPVPPDQKPAAPIEEPPETHKPPMGDVDDSPKRIADES